MNSLEDEGAFFCCCNSWTERAWGRRTVFTPLCRWNCALPLRSDALICWRQPKPSLSEEPSWGPQQRRNTQSALEVILWTVAAEGGGWDWKKKCTLVMRRGRGVNALCANRPARVLTKRPLLRKWLCAWQVAIPWCCVHSERLVFHACSETNYPFRGCFQSFPTNTGFESS